MTSWVVAVLVVAMVGGLVWWSSGRAKPDLRRRSIDTEIGIQRGRSARFDAHGDPGPTGSGPSGSGPG